MTTEYYFYDKDHVLPSFGMNNTGAICWANSMFQLLFSLPAFNQLALELSFQTQSELLKRYGDVLRANSGDLGTSQKLLGGFVYEAQKKKKTIDFVGQEGVANALCVFLELLGNDFIYNVINNRYLKTIKCTTCDTDTSIQSDKFHMIEMYNNSCKNREEFQQFIKIRTTPVDKYICEKCKNTMTNIYQIEKLRMLREIILVMFDKSSDVKWFPDHLEFESSDDKILRYKVVGAIEHGGSLDRTNYTSGGHYWAKCLRGGSWKMFNDSSVTDTVLAPNPNIHIIAYHLTEHVAP
jgi:ubiquitin C-terminal hydrolase